MDFCRIVVTNSSWYWSSWRNLIKGMFFDYSVFEIIINISSPNSCSNLFCSPYFWNVNYCVSCCFWQGHFWQGDSYIDTNMRKCWTDLVAIFKLLCVCSWSPSRRNFSLVACYSLKLTRCSLLVVKSLVTRCKICSLLVAEVACCKKSLVTCWKICSLLVAEVESLFATFLKSDSSTGVFL